MNVSRPINHYLICTLRIYFLATNNINNRHFLTLIFDNLKKKKTKKGTLCRISLWIEAACDLSRSDCNVKESRKIWHFPHSLPNPYYSLSVLCLVLYVSLLFYYYSNGFLLLGQAHLLPKPTSHATRPL